VGKPKEMREGFSLNWGLTGLVMGCWLVPILLIIAALSHYTTIRVRQQVDDTIQRAAASAAYNSHRELESLVAASRQASIDVDIRQAYRHYQGNSDEMVLYHRVTYYLSRQYRYNDSIISTMLFLTEEPEHVYVIHNPTVAGAQAQFTQYQEMAHGEIEHLSQTLDTRILFYSEGGSLYMVRNLVDKQYNPYAVIVMLLDEEKLFEGFGNISGSTGIVIWLNDTRVDFRSPEPGGELAGFELPPYTSLGRGERAVAEFGDSIILYGRESIDGAHMLYAIEIDRQFFAQHLYDLRGLIAVLVAFLIPLLLFTAFFLYRNIILPIRRLETASRAIREGNLGYVVNERVGNNEFDYLTRSINSMSVQLKEQFEHIYNEELALRDAHIIALQSQINPHFLGNTLEIINWEIRMGQSTRASRMIEALSTMLGAAMGRRSAPLVPLSQELMYVDAYLYILSERFGKRLEIRKEIDENLLHERIPCLIMQPIIENAVEHGMTPQQTGAIVIRAKRKEGRAHMEVENNTPMSPRDREQVDRLLSPGCAAKGEGSLHLGIRNVNMRLQMIYGEEYGLSITSDGNSTTSAFCIPLYEEGKTIQ